MAHELQEIRDDPTATQAKPRKSKLRWIVWSVGLIAILGYLALTKVPLTEFVHELLTCNPWWLLATALLLVITRTVMALKWWVILQGEGIRLPFGYVWHVTFASDFLGPFAPSGLGLEAVRVWYLSRDHGVGAVGMASAVIDRVISVAALAIVALVALLSLDQPFPGEELIDAGAAALFLGFVAGPAWHRRSRAGSRHTVQPGDIMDAPALGEGPSRSLREQDARAQEGCCARTAARRAHSDSTELRNLSRVRCPGIPALLGVILAVVPVVMFIGNGAGGAESGRSQRGRVRAAVRAVGDPQARACPPR